MRRGFFLYCSALYCFSFAKASSVQYRICEPAISRVTGSGTNRFSIHRCKVARWIPRSLAASEIEYSAIYNMRHGVAYCQVIFLHDSLFQEYLIFWCSPLAYRKTWSARTKPMLMIYYTSQSPPDWVVLCDKILPRRTKTDIMFVEPPLYGGFSARKYYGS